MNRCRHQQPWYVQEGCVWCPDCGALLLSGGKWYLPRTAKGVRPKLLMQAKKAKGK